MSVLDIELRWLVFKEQNGSIARLGMPPLRFYADKRKLQYRVKDSRHETNWQDVPEISFDNQAEPGAKVSESNTSK